MPQHLLHKSKVIVETIWKYLHISILKKNSFRGSYSRKYVFGNNLNKLDWLTPQAVYNLSTCSFSWSIDLVEILTRLMIPHSSHYIKQMTAHGSILGRGKIILSLMGFSCYLLITCSWHQKTKPPIHQFTNLKCCIKAREPFKTPF